MRNETCCFTGHRQIPPGERAEIASRLERVISDLYQRGIRYYGAGGALGFDALAARTVIRLRENCPGMKLILVLPCLTQTRGWRPEDIAEYERIKAQADKVVYTAQQYTPGCMHRRNRHLVDNSGVCVCYLTRNSGGDCLHRQLRKETRGKCIQYCRKYQTLKHFFASRKNFFKICAKTTRLGSGQKTSDFGKISYAYKKFKINRDLQKSGPSL